MDIYTATKMAYKNGYEDALNKTSRSKQHSTSDDVVLKFIKEFSSVKDGFTTGRCYWFAYILKERFGASIYYDAVKNHFVAKINGNYYDASGMVTGDFIPWDTYKDIDPVHFARLVRNCIEFLD